jgi:hypothetical protein
MARQSRRPVKNPSETTGNAWLTGTEKPAPRATPCLMCLKFLHDIAYRRRVSAVWSFARAERKTGKSQAVYVRKRNM